MAAAKKLLVVVIVMIAAAALAACGGDDKGGGGSASLGPDDAVAIEVGAEKITNGEIERRAVFNSTAPTGPEPVEPPARDSKEFAEFRTQAAEALRNERVFGILATRCGKPCAVTDKEVTDLLDNIRDEQFNGSQEQFTAALKQRGIGIPDLRLSLRASRQEQKLTDRERNKVAYTDAEGQAYYKKNINQYKLIAEKRLSHILLDTRAEALKVRADVTPENFAQIARTKSKDSAAQTPGGEDLGSITSGSLLPELQAAATTLKAGQISQPVQSQFGWHILLLRDIKARTKSYDEVKGEIRAQEIQIKQEAAVQKWRDTVLKKEQDKAKYLNDKVAPEKPAASTTSSTNTTGTAPATTSTATPPAETSGGTTSGPATP